jgi:RNA polymerase sigma-54 factor
MKQSLQLKLGQQLTMTPQLQQAIRLLQLSTLDLQQEIQQALEGNPMLEMAEDDDSEQPADHELLKANSDGPLDSQEGTATDSSQDDSSDWEQALPEDLPVDTQWDDLLPSSSTPPASGDDSPEMDFDARNSASESLQDQLLWQLSLTRMSDTDRLIAMAIIDATDANGRLVMSVEEIHLVLSEDLDIDLEEVVAVLHRLQQFEPAGSAPGTCRSACWCNCGNCRPPRLGSSRPGSSSPGTSTSSETAIFARSCAGRGSTRAS